MLSSKQNDLYNTIKTKRIPVIEGIGDFYIINQQKITNATNLIVQRFLPIEKASSKEDYTILLKKIISLIDAHFEINNIKGIDIKSFISRLKDAEIEHINNYISRVYIY